MDGAAIDGGQQRFTSLLAHKQGLERAEIVCTHVTQLVAAVVTELLDDLHQKAEVSGIVAAEQCADCLRKS